MGIGFAVVMHRKIVSVFAILLVLFVAAPSVSAETTIPESGFMGAGESADYTVHDQVELGEYFVAAGNGAYCAPHQSQGMDMNITIAAGDPVTMTVTLYDEGGFPRFEPSNVTWTHGSTITFTIDSGTHNVVLPWDEPKPEARSEDTPGFMMPIMIASMFLALLAVGLVKHRRA